MVAVKFYVDVIAVDDLLNWLAAGLLKPAEIFLGSSFSSIYSLASLIKRIQNAKKLPEVVNQSPISIINSLRSTSRHFPQVMKSYVLFHNYFFLLRKILSPSFYVCCL